MPKLPQGIEELKELPDAYKLTKSNKQFLASPVNLFSQFIILASVIGLNILSKSEKWWCDGTFKSSPNLYYQHYIIHGRYNGWPLPGMFTFLSGKTKDIYCQMFTTLKDAAFVCNLVLNPKVIAVDFEQGAIATFRAHLSNAKIIGCHFHLTSYYHF